MPPSGINMNIMRNTTQRNQCRYQYTSQVCTSLQMFFEWMKIYIYICNVLHIEQGLHSLIISITCKSQPPWQSYPRRSPWQLTIIFKTITPTIISRKHLIPALPAVLRPQTLWPNISQAPKRAGSSSKLGVLVGGVSRIYTQTVINVEMWFNCITEAHHLNIY